MDPRVHPGGIQGCKGPGPPAVVVASACLRAGDLLQLRVLCPHSISQLFLGWEKQPLRFPLLSSPLLAGMAQCRCWLQLVTRSCV